MLAQKLRQFFGAFAILLLVKSNPFVLVAVQRLIPVHFHFQGYEC